MSYILGGIAVIIVVAAIATWALIRDYKNYEKLPENIVYGIVEGKNSIENYYDISFPMTVYFVTIRCQDGTTLIVNTNYQTYVKMEKLIPYAFTIKGDSIIDVVRQ